MARVDSSAGTLLELVCNVASLVFVSLESCR